jgi:hypothetical protein
MSAAAFVLGDRQIPNTRRELQRRPREGGDDDRRWSAAHGIHSLADFRRGGV